MICSDLWSVEQISTGHISVTCFPLILLLWLAPWPQVGQVGQVCNTLALFGYYSHTKITLGSPPREADLDNTADYWNIWNSYLPYRHIVPFPSETSSGVKQSFTADSEAMKVGFVLNVSWDVVVWLVVLGFKKIKVNLSSRWMTKVCENVVSHTANPLRKTHWRHCSHGVEDRFSSWTV